MKVARCSIVGITPYSQSRFYGVEHPKSKDETHDAYATRCWMYHLHANEDGEVFIPPMSIKFMIDGAAKRRSDKIPGKGSSTYAKHFASGIVVSEGMMLGMKLGDSSIRCEAFFCSADGRRGGSKRVMRPYPMIDKWGGTFDVHVLDGKITEEVFADTLQTASMEIGLGRFRPENGGLNGRFEVKSIEWSK